MSFFDNPGRRRQARNIVLAVLVLSAPILVLTAYFNLGLTPALVVALTLNIAIRFVKRA